MTITTPDIKYDSAIRYGATFAAMLKTRLRELGLQDKLGIEFIKPTTVMIAPRQYEKVQFDEKGNSLLKPRRQDGGIRFTPKGEISEGAFKEMIAHLMIDTPAEIIRIGTQRGDSNHPVAFLSEENFTSAAYYLDMGAKKLHFLPAIHAIVEKELLGFLREVTPKEANATYSIEYTPGENMPENGPLPGAFTLNIEGPYAYLLNSAVEVLMKAAGSNNGLQKLSGLKSEKTHQQLGTIADLHYLGYRPVLKTLKAIDAVRSRDRGIENARLAIGKAVELVDRKWPETHIGFHGDKDHYERQPDKLQIVVNFNSNTKKAPFEERGLMPENIRGEWRDDGGRAQVKGFSVVVPDDGRKSEFFDAAIAAGFKISPARRAKA